MIANPATFNLGVSTPCNDTNCICGQTESPLGVVLTREMERVAKNPDNWQERLNALLEMQKTFEAMDQDGSLLPALNTDVWKTLKPLKGMLQDLRSQIVKETCALLTTISRTTKDAMAPFLREVLVTLVEVRGSGNKVCGTYCAECIETVVTLTIVKGPTLRMFVDMQLDSKNKLIRLSCITCMKLAASSWSQLLDKSDVQQLEKGLRSALYDASASCRSQAHELFLVFHQKFPKRSSVLMTSVEYKIQKRLEALVATDAGDAAAQRGGGGSASNASVDENGQPDTSTAGYNLDIGDCVCLPDREKFGIVRYIGEVDSVKGVWVGIELKEPCGKNDGSIKGRHYFRCPPKHGVFARPHQVMLVKTSEQVQEERQRQTKKSTLGDSYIGNDSAGAERILNEMSEELDEDEDGAPVAAYPQSPPPAPAPGSALPAPVEITEPSKLSVVLAEASILHRRYVDRLLEYVDAEMLEHQRFANYASTASSIDAVQYLQQLQNSAQDKIVLSSNFIQEIIKAQQAARES